MFFLIQGGCLKENLFCSIVLFFFQILGWFLLSTGLTPTGTQQICIALLQFEWNSCERPYLKVFFNIISCWNQNENVYHFQCHKLHFFSTSAILGRHQTQLLSEGGKIMLHEKPCDFLNWTHFAPGSKYRNQKIFFKFLK